MLSVLSETQQAIVETVTMRLHVTQALQYLKDAGHEISRAKYYRQKKKIEGMKLERMQHVAMYFHDQHLDRLDKIELIEKLMWDNYHAEMDPTKKNNMLVNIMHMQTYISAYYDITRYVLETKVKTYADIEKLPRNYLSININQIREKEVKEEAEKRRFQMYKEREREGQQARLVDNNDNNNNETAIVNFATNIAVVEQEAKAKPIDTPQQKQQPELVLAATNEEEQAQEETEHETEADIYWSTHQTPKQRPKDRNANSQKFISG